MKQELSSKESRRRLNRKIKVISLVFLLGLLFAAAAAVIVYFLNYQ